MFLTGVGTKRPLEEKLESNIRKRTAIDFEMKLRIIKKYEEGQGLSSIARELMLAVSSIHTIVKDAPRIKNYVKGSVEMKETIIAKKREGAMIDMENLLIAWIEDQQRRCIPLTVAMIKTKARLLFEEVKGRYPDGVQAFAASNGWFARFKNRVCFNKIPGENISGELEVDKDFCDWIRMVIDEGLYSPDQIFKVDETGLIYKQNESSLTLLLGGNASGTCKLKPFVIHHHDNPRALKGISKAILPVYYKNSTRAIMSQPIFENWFKNCFIPEVEQYCYDYDIPFQILLVMDNASCHPAHLDDYFHNVKVIYLPSTFVMQPVGQTMVATFKAHYLCRTFSQAIEALDADPDLTLKDFWKTYNIYHSIKNIAIAWEDVPETCLIRVWKQVCPQFLTENVQRYDKDETVDEVRKKINKLSKELELNLDKKEVKDFIDLNDERMTTGVYDMDGEDGEIKEDIEMKEEPLDARVQIKKEMPELIKIKQEEKPEKTEVKVKSEQEEVSLMKEEKVHKTEVAEAFQELSSALCRFERLDPNMPRFLIVKQAIEESISCYKKMLEDPQQ